MSCVEGDGEAQLRRATPFGYSPRPMSALPLRGYYAILDVPGAALDEGAGGLDQQVARAEELLAARPCCLQLRAKRLAVRDLLALARALVPVCQRAGVPFCLNDRLDLALVVGAGAVHLGQDDLPLTDARRVLAAAALGPAVRAQLAVGVSTHSLAQAEQAVREGADYIGFGPVFATSTKLQPDPVVGLEALARVARAVPVPVVAIGGITRATLPAVVQAGAAAAAIISDIERAPSRAAAARDVTLAFGS
jgi:thiamine-phosphate pyrophosphorylase